MANTTKKPALGQTAGSSVGPTFEPSTFTEELATAPGNELIGNRLYLENDRVEIWELALAPGDRLPFHCHRRDYFWSCVDPGRVQQRYDDGTSRVVDVAVGDTNFLEYGPGEVTIHDLQNVGDTHFRCVTVVLK